ncbi:MAG: thioredoxin family protein [bacterium]
MAEHTIEVFSAGCILCDNAVRLIRELAGSRSAVHVYDMSTGDALVKVREYGVTRVPSVVVDGRLVRCCQGDALDEQTLRSLGLGSSI